MFCFMVILNHLKIWNGFAEKLAADFRVISVDLPGHGLSDVFGETHTMEFMATVIKELLDNLGIKKVFLVGHSLGGYVTLAFLELFPEYLSGYCLFHSQPFADSPEAIEKRMREIAIVKAGKKELMYPDNVTRMFATSNLEKFQDALQRSKDIASRIPGEGIIAVLNGMMIQTIKVIIYGRGKSSLSYGFWVQWIIIFHVNQFRQELNYLQMQKLLFLKTQGIWDLLKKKIFQLKTIKEFVNSNYLDFCPADHPEGQLIHIIKIM